MAPHRLNAQPPSLRHHTTSIQHGVVSMCVCIPQSPIAQRASLRMYACAFQMSSLLMQRIFHSQLPFFCMPASAIFSTCARAGRSQPTLFPDALGLSCYRCCLISIRIGIGGSCCRSVSIWLQLCSSIVGWSFNRQCKRAACRSHPRRVIRRRVYMALA